jgi:hypothetical protein
MWGSVFDGWVVSTEVGSRNLFQVRVAIKHVFERSTLSGSGETKKPDIASGPNQPLSRHGQRPNQHILDPFSLERG